MEPFWRDFPATLAIFLIFGGWIIAYAIGTVTSNWRKVRESEYLAALKQSMVERGMSAEEIERVINAGRDDIPVPRQERIRTSV